MNVILVILLIKILQVNVTHAISVSNHKHHYEKKKSFYQENYFYYKNVEDDLSESQKAEHGRLTGDVQNWASIIQNYIIQSASDLINRDLTQSLFDLANYTVEKKKGEQVVEDVKEILSNYFIQKQEAAIVSIFFCKFI
jgi:DNA phosphorothioation-dependent restriction protein DptG